MWLTKKKKKKLTKKNLTSAHFGSFGRPVFPKTASVKWSLFEDISIFYINNDIKVQYLYDNTKTPRLWADLCIKEEEIIKYFLPKHKSGLSVIH